METMQCFEQATKFCQETLNLKETQEILVSVFAVNSFQGKIGKSVVYH